MGARSSDPWRVAPGSPALRLIDALAVFSRRLLLFKQTVNNNGQPWTINSIALTDLFLDQHLL